MRELSVEEVKKVQLDILKAVDKWCRENGVNYFMTCGTLLGAVRHKGYIPWDDDVDIVMLRPDYERFISEFNKNRNDDLSVLHFSIDPKFPYEFAKIQNKKTKMQENAGIQYDLGINIDLFVLDNLGSELSNAEKLAKKLRFPNSVFDIKLTVGNKYHKRTLIKSIGVGVLKVMAAPISVNWCINRINRIAKSHAEEEPGEYLVGLSSRSFNPTQKYKYEWFKDSVELSFEDNMFKAPVGYDGVLKVLYGDYMCLPPAEKQVTHHDYKAYER